MKWNERIPHTLIFYSLKCRQRLTNGLLRILLCCNIASFLYSKTHRVTYYFLRKNCRNISNFNCLNGVQPIEWKISQADWSPGHRCSTQTLYPLKHLERIPTFILRTIISLKHKKNHTSWKQQILQATQKEICMIFLWHEITVINSTLRSKRIMKVRFWGISFWATEEIVKKNLS